MGKKRVAVLGGGLGSMTAAYYLTNREGWDDEYEVTVYQQGWRLGGKGASGRAMRPRYGHRIEEHGLHIWFGFYENGFRMMRDALAKLRAQANPPVATFSDWSDAFTPQSLITLEERFEDGYRHWPLLFPVNGDTPGTGGEISLWDAMVDLLGWIEEAIEAFLSKRDLIPRVSLIDEGVHTLIGKARRHAQSMAPPKPGPAPERHSLLADMIEGFLKLLWPLVKNHLGDTEVRRLWVISDLGGTAAIGMLRDEVFSRGFEAIDGEDFIAWIARHGAKPVTQTSAPVEAIYDLVFGFDRGDTTKPDFAAGTCVRGVLRLLFTYKGAVMFKMMAGMGDTIFTPLYGLLAQRGVKFEFFHRVDRLALTPDRDMVGEIHLTRQVRLKGDAYHPLVRVNGLDCWPGEPLWEQIADAEALQDDPYNPGHPYDLESYYSAWQGVERRTLRLGSDFDLVMLGIPVGALPSIAPDLIAADERWQAMVANVKTVQTQGVQLWLTPTTKQLGWKIPDWAADHPSRGLDPVLGAYAQALDTWADMSHLLPQETWPPGLEPGSVAYFCGPFSETGPIPPFSDHAFPVRERARCMREGLAWFSANAAHLWPNGSSPQQPTGLNPALLVDPEGAAGQARFDSQWWRVNVDPSERYTLTVKGSTRHRIDGADCGFANLYLAGDWTLNGVLNAGCVEATVASGMRASRAVCGEPEVIVGEDGVDSGSRGDLGG